MNVRADIEEKQILHRLFRAKSKVIPSQYEGYPEDDYQSIAPEVEQTDKLPDCSGYRLVIVGESRMLSSHDRFITLHSRRWDSLYNLITSATGISTRKMHWLFNSRLHFQ